MDAESIGKRMAEICQVTDYRCVGRWGTLYAFQANGLVVFIGERRADFDAKPLEEAAQDWIAGKGWIREELLDPSLFSDGYISIARES